MSLAYQRAATPASGWDAWGTLVYGTTRIALRQLMVVGGIALLLAVLLLRIGGEGLVALWTNALFLGPLVLLGSLTRTVSLRLILRMFFIGSALMGVMYLLSLLLGPLLADAELRGLLVPLVEESLKIAPVVVLLVLWRRRRAWSLGATDILLLAAAAGVGFGVVEDAYIRAESGWPDQIAWLPVTELIGGRLIVGHGIWTALAGATIGLGLLLRQRGPIWLAVAASGFAVSVLDHAANNYGNVASGALAETLNAISFSGWLPLVAFLALGAACIGADIYVLRKLEPAPHRTPPARAPGLAGLRLAWEFLTVRRGLAIADFHRRRLPEVTRQAAGQQADFLDQSLAAFHPPARADSAPTGTGPPPGPTPPTDPGGVGGGMLLVLSLLGVAVTAFVGLVAPAAALGPAAVILAALDVGANCDIWCVFSGGGGLGGSGDPGDPGEHSGGGIVCLNADAEILDRPSPDGNVVGVPPVNPCLPYSDVWIGPDGQTWYKVHPPGGTPGWVPDSGVSHSPPAP